MKASLFIITLFLVRITAAQPAELTGLYGASFMGAESIEFVKADSFYFSGFYCTYGVKGKGVCAVKNGFLYLHFSKEAVAVQQAVIIPPQINYSNAALPAVRLRLLNSETGLPVPYAVVSATAGKKKLKDVAASDSGFTEFQLPLSAFPVQLRITAVSFYELLIPLGQPGVYNISAYMRPDMAEDKVLNNGEVIVYELGEITDTFFEARPAYSNGSFRMYRKKELRR